MENSINVSVKKINAGLGDEKIFFYDKIKKKMFGVLGGFQERNFIITNKALYNFKKDEIKRRNKIEDLYGITYSTKSKQFILHFNENDYDYLFTSEKRDEIIILLQTFFKKLKKNDILFNLKEEPDLSKYVVLKKERKSNPYLFKFDKNNLTPIEEFFKFDKKEQEEPKVINLYEVLAERYNIQNENKIQQDNNKIKTILDNNQSNLNENKASQIKVEKKIQPTFIVKDDLKEIKNEQIKKFAEKIKRENNNIAIVSTVDDIKDTITIFFESSDQMIRCAALCKSSDYFNSVVNKLFERAPEFREYANIFLCNGNKINDYKSLRDNKIKNGDHIILINQDDDND